MRLPDNPKDTDKAPAEAFETETYWDRLVADYARCGLAEADLMPVGTWLVLRRDAFVWDMRRTPGGRAWLADAWRLSRTDMDAAALREHYGGGARV